MRKELTAESIHIRIGTLGDTEFLANSARCMLIETEGREIPSDQVRAGVQKILNATDRGFYIVAAHEAVFIGSLLVTPFWIDLANGAIWWLSCIYVLPEYRGKNAYRLMYAYVKEIAAKGEDVRGFRLCVHPGNTAACRAYEHLGMAQLPYRMYQELPG